VGFLVIERGRSGHSGSVLHVRLVKTTAERLLRPVGSNRRLHL
jgi:hypothetical protein